MRQFIDHGYSRKNDLMDGLRAVFERGMLAQHLLLFRERSRSKRYMNILPGLTHPTHEHRPPSHRVDGG
ncbi:hypothetical protein F3K53_11390 [Pseudomonas veronii]|uniref:Uncharacterized protein n=1 Tax=Pseudomonas veronii TaxID=76761 RepID=A0A5M8F7U4_PSEVE|nr:hypothetical protein F3K54_30455 [Pseudomonas veronii]KAA6180953.1 hypothetical protein F3K53_11390 [Pseudomonas veronii]